MRASNASNNQTVTSLSRAVKTPPANRDPASSRRRPNGAYRIEIPKWSPKCDIRTNQVRRLKSLQLQREKKKRNPRTIGDLSACIAAVGKTGETPLGEEWWFLLDVEVRGGSEEKERLKQGKRQSRVLEEEREKEREREGRRTT